MGEAILKSAVNHFRGRSEHALDGKGRLNIPSRFRDVLRRQYDDRLMLSMLNRCIRVYPLAQWEELEVKLLARLQEEPDSKKMIRYIIGGVEECQLDKQGRILLPPKMREEAGIGNNVVLTGVMTHFEIHDKGVWEEVSRPSAEDFENFEKSLLRSGLL